jgi:hypothetical protein
LASWDDIFRHATAVQHQEWLGLAASNGILYSHQIANSTNGHSSASSPPNPHHFLKSMPAGLEPLIIDPDDVRSATLLDESQRQAVALALQTPDVGLIQGSAGTGKSLVVAEAISLALERGWKVLFVAPDTTALDFVLGLLLDRPHVFAMRALGKNECEEALSPRIREITLTQRVRSLQSRTLAGAAVELERFRQVLRQLMDQEGTWNQLREILRKCLEISRERDQLCRKQDDLHAEVEREVARLRAGGDSGGGEFATQCIAVARTLDEDLRQSQSRLDQSRAAWEERSRDLEQAAHLLETTSKLHAAKQGKRWWSPSWWRATLQGDVAARLTELEKKVAELRAELVEFDRQMAKAREDQERARQSAARAERDLISTEAARLQDESHARIRLLDDCLARERGRWQQVCQPLEGRHGRLDEVCPSAFAAAHEHWQREVDQAARRLQDLEQWFSALQHEAPSFPEHVLAHVNLVAAPTCALGLESLLPTSSGTGQPAFELLILEDAHLVAEAHFSLAAAQAQRWVLVGEPALADENRTVVCPVRMRGQASQRARAEPRPAAFFHRLWDQLHCDPRKQAGTWLQENGRICCRLRSIAPEERQWLETEAVADSSEIELRIYSPPRAAPQLAEVVFPNSMNIAEAKSFIFRELQELPLRSQGHSLNWQEQEDRLVLQLADAPAAKGTVLVALEPGVRELVYLSAGSPGAVSSPESANAGLPAATWHTCCIEFERGAGWHRTGARQWIKRMAGLEDLGRTVRLRRCHRMAPELGHIIAEWIGAAPPPSPVRVKADSESPAVSFIPVPPLPRHRQDRTRRPERGRHAEATNAPNLVAVLPRSGAGLELDLADPRQRERLPVELREGLPSAGIVNYLEAQSILRALPDVLENKGTGRVAVLALYSAQAQLLRNMMRHNPRLAAQSAQVPIDTAHAFRHQDFDSVLVSMTRSHSHRAVGFGDGPESLPLALTRPRRELLLFADPGTIARRVQWEGPVDNFDESASGRERETLVNLLRFLQGQGNGSGWFRIRESTGA